MLYFYSINTIYIFDNFRYFKIVNIIIIENSINFFLILLHNFYQFAFNGFRSEIVSFF